MQHDCRDMQELVVLLDELRVKKDTIVALGHKFGARHIREQVLSEAVEL